MHAIYPLFELNSDFERKDICPGIYVSVNDFEIGKYYSYNLSEEDKDFIQMSQFCLSIDTEQYEPRQASIIFVIACRLLKNTKVFIRYRLDNDEKKIYKIRDDYPYLPSEKLTNSIRADEFTLISKIMQNLFLFKDINMRTSNASYFLSLAYRSRKWLESLLFHVCALETLTSASEWESGNTQKFVNRIFNYIQYDKEKLKRVYDLRSELIHGRLKWSKDIENLNFCRMAEEISRTVFSKILLKEDIKLLENDEYRINLFEKQ